MNLLAPNLFRQKRISSTHEASRINQRRPRSCQVSLLTRLATCRMHCVGRCCWHSLRQLFFNYLTHSSCLKTLNQTKCSVVKEEEKQPFFSLKPAAVSTHQPAQLSGAKLGPTSMLQSFYHFHCNQHPNRYANAACLAGGVLFCSGLGFLFFLKRKEKFHQLHRKRGKKTGCPNYFQ